MTEESSPATATRPPPPALIVSGRYDLPRDAWLPAHQHETPQLAWAQRGVLSVCAGGRRWVLPPRLALWIPAGIVHETGTAVAADMLGLYVRPECCSIRWDSPTVVRVGSLARELLGFLTASTPGRTEREHAESLLFGVLTPVSGVLIDVPMPRDRRARAVARSVVSDPGDRRSLRSWADSAAVSERTLARIWSAEAGIGFARWRTRVRVQAALPLLADQTPVATVARRVGYGTPSAFVAAFHREVGAPPGAYVGAAGTSA